MVRHDEHVLQHGSTCSKGGHMGPPYAHVLCSLGCCQLVATVCSDCTAEQCNMLGTRVYALCKALLVFRQFRITTHVCLVHLDGASA